MKIKVHIYAWLLTLVMAAGAFVSCSRLESDALGEKKYGTVLLRISTCEQVDPARAQAAATRSSVLTAEQEQQIHSLRIYAFTNGQRVGYHYQPSPQGRDVLLDIEMLAVDVSTGQQAVQFYVIANEAAMLTENDMPLLGESTTEAQLQSYRFISMDPSKGLPLFYSQTILLDMTDYQPQEGGQLLLSKALSFQLKRPIGKIGFSARKNSNSNQDVYITSLKLLARGTRHYNYIMPQTDEQLKQLSPRKNDELLLDEGQTAVITQTSFQEVAQLYCAELPFGSAEWNQPNSDNSPVLCVEYSIGAGEQLRTTYIYLPRIERNSFIDVRCVISGEGQLKVNYQVRDWEHQMQDQDGDGEEDFIIFDYPTHSYLLPTIPTQENPAPEPDASEVPQTSVTAPFVCYFQMLYPEGQTWKPTLLGVDASVTDYTIKVYEGSTGIEASCDALGYYGLNTEENLFFRIEVYALNAKNVGARVGLGITSDIQGFVQSEYLLINGTEHDMFWPLVGGNDPHALLITQIE